MGKRKIEREDGNGNIPFELYRVWRFSRGWVITGRSFDCASRNEWEVVLNAILAETQLNLAK